MILRASPTLLDTFTESKQEVIREVSRLNPPAKEGGSLTQMGNVSNPFLAHIMLINTIGLSIVVESFSEAYYFLSHNSSTTSSVRRKAEEFRDSFIFIQGTGLEKVIQEYGIGYDADALRRTFFTLADRKDLINDL